MRFLSASEVLSLRRIHVDRTQVHVWPLLLQAKEQETAPLEQLLSAEERERAAKFRSNEAKAAFVISRALMRHVLSGYSGVDAGLLEIASGEWGKPMIARAELAAGSLSFNLSHSKGRALLAVSVGREIGVDIECVRVKTDALALANGYFFGSEYEAIHAAPDERRQQEFFRYWTAKEAVLKAEGVGLRVPLDCFRVVFDTQGETAEVETFDPGRIRAGWFVRTLECGEGWSGAVATEAREWSVQVIGGPGEP
jgi:4'-phosphopantetheinyl transferase